MKDTTTLPKQRSAPPTITGRESVRRGPPRRRRDAGNGPRGGLPTAIWLLCLLVVVAVVLYPLVRILWLSASDAATGAVDTTVLLDVLTDPATWVSTWNTTLLAFVATAVGLVVAVPMAWSCTRTNIPFRRAVRALVFLTFMNPPILLGLAYVTLLGPNSGVLTPALAPLGLSTSIYSWWGLVLVTVCTSYPIIFMTTATALETLDADLENAAAAHGATRWTTTARVTIPLIRPAIASGCLLSFVLALNSFGVQALIATPARIPLLTTDIYGLFSFPVQFTAAADLSVILIAMSLTVSVAVNIYVARRTFATIVGKGFRPSRIHVTGPARVGLVGYNLTVTAVTLVVPMAIVVVTSFLPSSRVLSLGELTLDAYRSLFSLGDVRQALTNSLLLGVVSAVVMAALALTLAYFSRQRMRGARPAKLIAEVPFVIPGIVLAVGMVAAYSRPPLLLYGTYLILVFAYVGKFLPITLRFTENALGQVGNELEESVYAHGGNRWHAFRTVLMPLIRRGVLTAGIISFIFAFNELSASILLISSGKEVSSTVLLNYAEEGLLQQMNAFAAVLFAVTTFCYVVIMRLAGRDFLGSSS